MITLKSCPNCDSDRIEGYRQVIQTPDVIYEIMPGVKVNATIISRYFICQDCNLIFQNPRMSDMELDKFYGKGYYRRIVDATDVEIDSAELSRAKTDAGIIERYIGQPTSHLDIGCGRGYLLNVIGASKKVGVEAQVGYLKVEGVEVYPEINKVPQKSFDLVTAIHVLEHVSKPLDYLKSMTKFVGKGGYLVVEVPTWKSPGGSLRLAHLFHFEPPVFRGMCIQNGLKIIHEEFTPHFLLICQPDEN